MKLIKCLSVISLFVGMAFTLGCSSYTLDMGPNGDSRLREISFKNKLMTPAFDPYHYDYVIYQENDTKLIGKVVPYIFYTKFTLNGHSVRMATNGYKLPVDTDLTAYFTNETATGKPMMVVDLTAQDGNQRKYTLHVRTAESYAGLSAIASANALLKSTFTESPAPDYRAGLTHDVYVFSANANSVTFDFTKTVATSKLSATGNAGEIGAGQKTVSVTFTGLGTGTSYFVTNISADGSNTNVKELIGTYYAEADDARIIELDTYVNGSKTPYLPKFDYLGGMQHCLVVDNAQNITIQGKLRFAATTLTLKINGAVSTTPIVKNNTDFSISNLPVSQGDIITLEAVKGSKTIVYSIETRLFSKATYDFNGGIKKLQDDVFQYLDMPTCTYTVSGIVTLITDYDENKKAGMYIEDGAYGLYVWTYNTWKSGIKVGHKVSILVTSAKVWMGMPEVYQSKDTSANTTILDGGKRYPLHYINANERDLGQKNDLARIMRFSTYDAKAPITGTYDESGIGTFTTGKGFKLFIPYTQSLSDIVGVSEAITYMKEGKEGVFFGPNFLDGDGASILMKGKEYMIVP